MTDDVSKHHCKHGTPLDPDWVCTQCHREALALSAEYSAAGTTVTQADDVSKLPAWPEKPESSGLFDSYCHQQGLAAAALARMEALERLVRDIKKDRGYMRISGMEPRIDALLAACERKEGR